MQVYLMTASSTLASLRNLMRLGRTGTVKVRICFMMFSLWVLKIAMAFFVLYRWIIYSNVTTLSTPSFSHSERH